jgi:hypothetical protein
VSPDQREKGKILGLFALSSMPFEPSVEILIVCSVRGSRGHTRQGAPPAQQFTKARNVLRGMGLEQLTKSEKAKEELSKKGMAFDQN